MQVVGNPSYNFENVRKFVKGSIPLITIQCIPCHHTFFWSCGSYISILFVFRAASCEPRSAAIRDLGIPSTFYEILVLGSSMKLPGDNGSAIFIVNITRRFPINSHTRLHASIFAICATNALSRTRSVKLSHSPLWRQCTSY